MMKTSAYAGLNKIYKCVAGERLHGRHFLTGDLVRKMTLIENRYPLAKLPMCGYCERAGLWTHTADGKMAGYCETCGTTTTNPITYAEYLSQGHDLPEHMRNSPFGKSVCDILDTYNAMFGLGERK
jgi:hypothetical protein